MVDETEAGGVEILEVERPSSRHRLSNSENTEPVLVGLKDHFTLPAPSNLVRFRSRKNAARVYDSKGVQMILEEAYNKETETSTISVKRLNDETSGVHLLRLLYTITCCLFTGFFFVFCLQVLLFLVLNLAVESGATENSSVNVGTTIGVVLAIIVFVSAFSEALVIAGHFVADIWSGHFLAKQFLFSKLDDVTIEWTFFTAFLLVPLLVMAGSLLADSAHWWSNTAIVWFGCVMGFFVLFCFNVVLYEVKAAYDFADNRNDGDSDRFLDVVRRCVLLRQRHKYSGKVQNIFLARSYFTNMEDTETTENANIYEETRVVAQSWWAKLSNKCPEWMFKKLDEPYRLFTIEDVQDFRPFLTKSTWGLEKIFCRPSNSRYIAIVNGPGALTQSQLRSSLLCSLIGTALIILLLVAFLVWFQIPGSFVAFVFVIALILSWSALTNTRNLFKVGNDMIDIKTGKVKDGAIDEEKAAVDEEDEVEEEAEAARETDKNISPPQGESERIWEKIGAEPSEAVYLVSEYQRVNEATFPFCWIMVRVEIAIFYIYPLVTLSVINWNLAVLFFICATISGIRHYINAAVVIEETGNMSLVGGTTESEIWGNKSRLNNIVGAITVSKSRRLWSSVLGVGGFGFIAVFLGAVGSSTENTSTETLTYLPNFYYPPNSDDMRYPTCTMSNLNGGFGDNSTLVDFAFLSSIAYTLEDNTQPALDSWFGPAGIVAVDEINYVKDFREEFDTENLPVYFKMFSFPEQKLSMISIRGTSNNWYVTRMIQQYWYHFALGSLCHFLQGHVSRYTAVERGSSYAGSEGGASSG
jgi:hypothetical protein